MQPKRTLALMAATFVAAAGCSGPPAEEDVLDLLAAFPAAEVRGEVSRIDFGTEDARPFLKSGFSWDEKNADDTTFVWGVGEGSQIELFSTESREVRGTARLSPRGGPRRVQVAVGGRAVAELELRHEIADYDFALPLTAGDNVVTFRYLPSPETTAEDRFGRQLAVAFFDLRLDLVEPDETRTSQEAGGGQLYLPYGAEIAFYVDAPGPARLTAARIRQRSGSGRLEVAWRDDLGGGEMAAFGDGPIAIPGREGSFRPLRITLRAVGPRREDGGWEGLVVEQPELHVTRVPAGQGATATHPGRAVPPDTHVLIYLVDTLRADRLGAYGQARGLTPRLDALAAESVVFDRMIAQASLTRPATASLLTGLGPLHHGVSKTENALPEEAVTLAELFRQAGYRTAAFTTNVNITTKTGFGQGFEHFDFSYDDSSDLTPRILAWIDGKSEIRLPQPPGALPEPSRAEEAPPPYTGQPFFLYVHTIDPHEPYRPRIELRQRFAPDAPPGLEGARGMGQRDRPLPPKILAALQDLYDGEVAQNDAAFGALWDALAKRGLPERTLVIFLADHGEQFQEHGIIGHGLDLHREVLHVPFLLRWPGGRPSLRVPEAVQQIDVLPTLVDLFGLERPPGLQGRSLVPLLSGHALPPSALYSYIDYEGRRGISVEQDGWKLIQPLNDKFGKQPSLYAPREDPKELTDRLSERPVMAGYLRALSRSELSHLGQGLEAAPAEVDEETRRELRALGYLQ